MKNFVVRLSMFVAGAGPLLLLIVGSTDDLTYDEVPFAYVIISVAIALFLSTVGMIIHDNADEIASWAETVTIYDLGLSSGVIAAGVITGTAVFSFVEEIRIIPLFDAIMIIAVAGVFLLIGIVVCFRHDPNRGARWRQKTAFARQFHQERVEKGALEESRARRG